jgi:hypothetical protein
VPAKTKSDEYNNMSTAAVQAKTGKTWAEWITALDAEGCAKLSHKEIVAVVNSRFGIGPWWQQMVTVGYEQAKGLRVKNQKADGFAVGVSKTLSVSAETLFKAFNDVRTRKKWLAEPITIRTATPAKSLRITWGDGPSSLSVNLYPKGEAKCQVTIQHEKIANAKEAAQLKKFWAEKIEALRALLEG